MASERITDSEHSARFASADRTLGEGDGSAGTGNIAVLAPTLRNPSVPTIPRIGEHAQRDHSYGYELEAVDREVLIGHAKLVFYVYA